jgi:hypothetical protein
MNVEIAEPARRFGRNQAVAGGESGGSGDAPLERGYSAVLAKVRG